MTLSLGLVIASTLLSPLVTPAALHSVAQVATGDYSEDLSELAAGSSSTFVIGSVVIPSGLGILLRFLLGEKRMLPILPALKLVNLIDLLVLNYANSAVALPQVMAAPDWDFLTLILAVMSILCILAFGTGAAIARLFRASRADRTALMFGLGMNNNGSGLVLALMALADHPRVMLAVLSYNLVQQLFAGLFDRRIQRQAAAPRSG